MPTNKNNILKTISISLISLSMLTGLSLIPSIQDSLKVNAAGSNNADLIIGKVDTGSAIELSICIKNTGDPLHLANATTWFDFDNSKLTPNPTIVQPGIYTTAANGYGPLKFQQVLPAPTAGQTSEKWTVRTDYFGGTVGLPGLLIPTTNNELIGKVKFDKIGTQVNPSISLVNSTYYSTEYATTPIAFNIINQNSVCTSSGVVTPTYTLGSYTGTLTGVVGQPFPSFTTIGCNLPTPTNNATVGVGGSTINGIMTYPGCIFTPINGAVTPTVFVGQTPLILLINGIPNLNIAANITNPQIQSSSLISSSISQTISTSSQLISPISTVAISSSSTIPASGGGGVIIITNKPAPSVSTASSANIGITKPSITDPLDCLQRITGNANGDSVKISLEFYDLKTGKLSYLFQDLPKSNSGDYLFQLNASDTSNPNYVASGDYKIKYIATDKNNQTVSGEYEANIKANAECKKITSENTLFTLPKTGGNTASTATAQQNAAQTTQQQALANVVSSGITPRSGGLTNMIIALLLFVIPTSIVSFLVFKRKDIPFFKSKK